MTVVWMDRTCLRLIEDEATRHFPLETGGVLAGYVADSGDVVVKAVVGAGPNALHRRLRFEPDHAWQCDRLDELYRKSKGLVAYLGDWHTHPMASPEMSLLDRRTLLKIARDRESRCAAPLMLIGARDAREWRWVVHQFQTRSLWLFAAAAEKCLRIFD